jgi:hypothetical protein
VTPAPPHPTTTVGTATGDTASRSCTACAGAIEVAHPSRSHHRFFSLYQ